MHIYANLAYIWTVLLPGNEWCQRIQNAFNQERMCIVQRFLLQRENSLMLRILLAKEAHESF